MEGFLITKESGNLKEFNTSYIVEIGANTYDDDFHEKKVKVFRDICKNIGTKAEEVIKNNNNFFAVYVKDFFKITVSSVYSVKQEDKDSLIKMIL